MLLPPSLASLARGLPIPSSAPPDSLQSPRSLRSLGLPASSVQWKPLHYVVRAREKAAQSNINPFKPNSLQCPLPDGLCYARPFACGSLLACWLRPPMRSRFARFVAALRSRSVLICSVAPLRLVGVALSAGAPAPLTALQASPAFLRARAPAACSRCPRYARAIRGLRPRGLRYASAEGMLCARGGLPILSACRGAVALAADSLGNLPPRSIVLRAGSALAAHVRYAHPLKIQN